MSNEQLAVLLQQLMRQLNGVYIDACADLNIPINTTPKPWLMDLYGINRSLECNIAMLEAVK